MRRVACLLTVAVVVGCGGDPGGPATPPPIPAPAPGMVIPPVGAGSRLAPRYLRHPGTEPLWFGVLDRQKQAPCWFVVSDNDRVRCVASRYDASAPGDAVAGRLERPAGVTRLGPIQVVSDDGGRFPLHTRGGVALFDRSSGHACAVEDGACLPPHGRFIGFYGDAGCRQRPLAADLAAPVAPVLVMKDGVAHALGARWTGAVYFSAGGACTPGDGYAGAVYEIAAPLAAGSVAPVRRSLRGSARLSLFVYEDDAGAITTEGYHAALDEAVYEDRALGACVPMRTSDAGIRCVAGATIARGVARYADPACRERAVAGVAAGGLVALGTTSDLDLPRVTAVHAVAEAIGHEMYEARQDACVKVIDRVGHWRVGAPVAWDRFAVLEEIVGTPAP